MKYLISLLWFGITCQIILAQNFKPLQISEMKIGQFNYPFNSLMDGDQNLYFSYWSGNGQTISDTVFINKLSKDGKLIKTLKINSIYGGLANTSFQKYGKKNFILAMLFTDSILIQNIVYKVRYNSANMVGVQGCILVKLNFELDIISHKFIGLGVNLVMNSISCLENKNILLGCRFTDTLDIRPIGGNLFVIPDSNLSQFLNIASIEIDSNFVLKSVIDSKSKGEVNITSYSNEIKSSSFITGYFSNQDSLRLNSNFRTSTILNKCPFIFKLDSNQKIKWSLLGTNLSDTDSLTDGHITSITEDKFKNFYVSMLNFGKFRLATSEFGIKNKFTTSVFKFDSLGNIHWAKTYPTYGGYFYQNEFKISSKGDRLIYCAALQDTFSIGQYNFSFPFGEVKKSFIAEFDLDGNVMNVIVLGYTEFGNGIDFMAANMDSAGNTYALFTTKGTGAFRQDCFQLPALSSLQNDSSRLVWLKFGPSTLKKDSIFKQWDICTGQGQIKALYKTKYPALQYQWNTQTVDSTFTFSQGGNYRLIVKDATCYADTNYFSFAPKVNILQPTIFGSNQANNVGSFLYHILVPDSLQINWQVAGGQIISGQTNDSIYVSWPIIGQGVVSYTLTYLEYGCQHSDSLSVLITSNNSIIYNNSIFKIYPNPTDNIVTISTKRLEKTYFNLTNILGHSLANGYLMNGYKQLDLSNLESGIYIIKLNSGTTRETIKVVKN